MSAPAILASAPAWLGLFGDVTTVGFPVVLLGVAVGVAGVRR